MKLTMQFACVTASALMGAAMVQGQTIPNNAKDTCPVTAATFKSWFVSGNPAVNGGGESGQQRDVFGGSELQFLCMVETDVSVADFAGAGDLWRGAAGASSIRPHSTTFRPRTRRGQRTFIAHAAGFTRTLAVRGAKLGPHGLPRDPSTRRAGCWKWNRRR